jgi:hypothetical protein
LIRIFYSASTPSYVSLHQLVCGVLWAPSVIFRTSNLLSSSFRQNLWKHQQFVYFAVILPLISSPTQKSPVRYKLQISTLYGGNPYQTYSTFF